MAIKHLGLFLILNSLCWHNTAAQETTNVVTTMPPGAEGNQAGAPADNSADAPKDATADAAPVDAKKEEPAADGATSEEPNAVPATANPATTDPATETPTAEKTADADTQAPSEDATVVPSEDTTEVAPADTTETSSETDPVTEKSVEDTAEAPADNAEVTEETPATEDAAETPADAPADTPADAPVDAADDIKEGEEKPAEEVKEEPIDYSQMTKWDLKEDIQNALNDAQTLENFDETGLYEKYISNQWFEDKRLKAMSDAGYISENLLKQFLGEILNKYPELASEVEVPHDFTDRSNAMLELQRVIKFRTQPSAPASETPDASRRRLQGCKSNSSILINGAHHARELVSIQMVCYTMLRLLYEYEWTLKQPSSELPMTYNILDVLACNDVYFVPVVNLDGYHFISKMWADTGSFTPVRKNLRYSGKACDIENIGTDLNRNYGFAFGYNDEGSSSQQCDFDYRGEDAFSEPGTRQIRNFLTKTDEGKSVKVALNLHSFGNLIIYPFAYLPLSQGYTASDFLFMTDRDIMEMFQDTLCFSIEQNYLMAYAKTDYTCPKDAGTVVFNIRDAFRFYNNLTKNAGLPLGAQAGTFTNVMYEVNGEASDWMLGNRGIYAMSPELSTVNPKTMEHFMESAEAVTEVLQAHYPWVRYTIMNMPQVNQDVQPEVIIPGPQVTIPDPNQGVYIPPAPVPAPVISPGEGLVGIEENSSWRFCRDAVSGRPEDSFCEIGEKCAEYEQMSSGGYFVGSGFSCILASYCGIKDALQSMGPDGPYPMMTQMNCSGTPIIAPVVIVDPVYVDPVPFGPAPYVDPAPVYYDPYVQPQEPAFVTPAPAPIDYGITCSVDYKDISQGLEGAEECSSWRFCWGADTSGASNSVCNNNERCAEYNQLSQSGFIVGYGFSCVLERYCGVSGKLTAQSQDGEYEYETTFACPDATVAVDGLAVDLAPVEPIVAPTTYYDDTYNYADYDYSVYNPDILTCAVGQIVVDGVCGYDYSTYNPDILSCPLGQIAVEGVCACPDGTQMIYGVCQPPVYQPEYTPYVDPNQPSVYPYTDVDPYYNPGTEPYLPEVTPQVDPITPYYPDTNTYTPEVYPYVPPSNPEVYPYVPPTTPVYDPYAAPATTPAYDPYAVPATTPAYDPYAAPATTPGVYPYVAPTTPAYDPYAAPATTPAYDPYATPATTPGVYPYVAPTTPAYDPYATTQAYDPYAAPATTPGVYPYVAPTTPAYDPYATTPAYNPYAAPANTPAYNPYAAPVSTYVDPASTYVAPVTQYDASGYPITATVSYYQQLAKVTPESTPEVTPEATLEAPLTIPTNTVSTPEGAPLTIPTNNVPTVSNGYYGWP